MLKLLRRKPKVDRLLKDALGEFSLPSFPNNVWEGLRTVRDPNARLEQIAEKLSVDPRISSQLLRTANAPINGLSRPVKNVHHAVSLLGRTEVESVVLSVAVMRSLPRSAVTGFDPQRFWTTAFRRATAARAVASLMHPATASESFTAALLQDMALPFLAHAKGPQYGRLVEEWRAGGGELAQLERDTFGWDHGRVAESICRAWSFPEGLQRSIGGHHDADAPSHDVPPAVALVARLPESEAPEPVEELITTVTRRTGRSEEDVRTLIDTAFTQAEGLFTGA